ncbi:hydrogenase maturation factor HypF (carbamoyltransferase family) [Pedobacter sp. UYP30]|uniref:hypothetical protein n=1 Tax=Pedobacter sp. UYP30 TaxID=1756400 RepID=UPI0033930D05
MGTIEDLKLVSKTAVQRLRKQKLENGKPFLVWSKRLPKEQSYLEYPDKSIKIVKVSPTLRSFIVIRELTDLQVQAIRREFDLY